MKRYWRQLIVMVVVGSLLVVTEVSTASASTSASTSAATSAATHGAKAKSGGTLEYLNGTEETGMDWTVGSASASIATSTFLLLVYDTLVRVDAAGKIQPRLAQSVTSTPDLLTWTVKLKPNLKFSDGTPFDASAIIFNWNRDSNPATGGRCVGDAAQMASYSMVDSLTVKAVLKVPNSQWPRNLMNCLGNIGSPTAFQKMGQAAFNKLAVGAGPYIAKEWIPNDHATFVRNPNYWDAPRPYIDTIIVRPVTDIVQRNNAFLAASGSTVFCGCSVISPYPDQLKAMGYPDKSTATWGGVAIGLNIAKVPAFADVNVRRAISYALDLHDLNLKASQGHATEPVTVFDKDSPFYDKSGTFPHNNLAKAQKLIDTYVKAHGPINVNFAVAAGSIQPWGDAITQELSRLKGVTINEQYLAGSTTAALLTSKDYQMIFTGGSGVDPDPNMYNNFHTGGQNNPGYSDPEMDKLLEKGRSSTSLAVRKAAYIGAAKIWVRDVPSIPVYRSISATVTSKNVKFSVYDAGFMDYATAQITGAG